MFVVESFIDFNMDEIKIVFNEIVRNDALIKEEDDIIKQFNKDLAKIVHQYHQTLPEYKPTPLRDLTNLSRKLNLRTFGSKMNQKDLTSMPSKFLVPALPLLSTFYESLDKIS